MSGFLSRRSHPVTVEEDQTLTTHVHALEEAAAKNHASPVDRCEAGFNRSDHFIDTLRICRSSNAVKKVANRKEGIFSIPVKVSRMVP